MQNALPILIFHTLDEPGPAICFSARGFRCDMAMLHQKGYRTLPLAEAAQLIRQGRPFPPRAFVLTFDDGYRSVYEKAFPVLQRYAMSATVFVTTGLQRPDGPAERLPAGGNQPMLSWDEIGEMHDWGVEIGAHSCTHPDLTRLPPERIEAELRDSKAIIEDMLGEAVRSFAYPYGRHDRRSLEIARQCFECACSDRLGLVTRRSDPHALERIDAYYLRPDGLFRLLPTRWFPSYVRLRRVARDAKRALQARRR
jgi:peptidoglycan/xylan/chitin deacetylase (PgdA/CDA1 family)